MDMIAAIGRIESTAMTLTSNVAIMAMVNKTNSKTLVPPVSLCIIVLPGVKFIRNLLFMPVHPPLSLQLLRLQVLCLRTLRLWRSPFHGFNIPHGHH